MPNNHLFTVCDSNVELKEHDSPLFIPVNHAKTNARLSSLCASSNIQEETEAQDMAQRQKFRRQRSQTLPNVALHSRNSAKRKEPAGCDKQKTPLRLSRSLDSQTLYKGPMVTAATSRQRARSLLPSQRVSFVPNAEANQRSIKDAQRLNYNRSSMELPTTDIVRSRRGRHKSESLIPSDDIRSIYSIVKARSFALRWYRGNNGSTKHSKRQQSVPLPTIDDKKSISLCKAKCSPQFAEVVHLLQDEVENVEDDLQVLSLE